MRLDGVHKIVVVTGLKRRRGFQGCCAAAGLWGPRPRSRLFSCGGGFTTSWLSEDPRGDIRAQTFIRVCDLLLVRDVFEVLVCFLLADRCQALLQLINLDPHQQRLKLSRFSIKVGAALFQHRISIGQGLVLLRIRIGIWLVACLSIVILVLISGLNEYLVRALSRQIEFLEKGHGTVLVHIQLLFESAELASILLPLLVLEPLLLLCVLLVELDQPQDIHQLVFLHADVHVFDIKVDSCAIAIAWLQLKFGYESDGLKDIALPILAHSHLTRANGKQLVQFVNPTLFHWFLAYEVYVIRLVIHTKVLDGENLIEGFLRVARLLRTVHEFNLPVRIGRVDVQLL